MHCAVNDYPADWPDIAKRIKDAAGWKCQRCDHPHDIESGHVLTVHHLDGDKSNCASWNLAALCQRCHLSVQGRVNMAQGYLFEHAEWMRPFVEGRKKAMETTE
jgi:5-methylcytosine-specific restriction endonuclease McrA